MFVLILISGLVAADDPDPKQARDALRKAVTFFRTRVSVKGGYVYRYSADLKKREGEGKVGLTTVWVQPPATPSVGMAFLRAYQLTSDRDCLDAARESAEMLLSGQLRSGGWSNRIEIEAGARKRYNYRVGPDSKKARNHTSLDDDQTQAAVQFLMHLDIELGGKDQPIREAVEYALSNILKAQYPNGAWPQGFRESPDPKKFPVKKASYPDSWSRKYTGHNNYWYYYTLNDGVMARMVELMWEAEKLYPNGPYRASAIKAGEFLIRAQMPDPQPAWAQQYNFDMHPAWARKFEPASITGGESQGILSTLMLLYRKTGQKRFLDPIPRALAYLKKSRLSNGRLARFYELKTNKPLYFTRKYELTYDSDDMPTHYGFIVSSKLDRIEDEYKRVLKLPADQLDPASDTRPSRPRMSRSLTGQAKRVIEQMDSRGAWVEDGRLRYHGKGDSTRRVIECRTFIENIDVLARYIAASARK